MSRACVDHSMELCRPVDSQSGAKGMKREQRKMERGEGEGYCKSDDLIGKKLGLYRLGKGGMKG